MNPTPDRSKATDDTPSPAKITADCYSAGERTGMEAGQKLRATLLRPALILLTRLRMIPDHITLLSALCGLLFPLLVWWQRMDLAAAALLLHVLLDGLDGPLARHQQVASPRGSLTDTFCDQLVLAAVTITWMSHVSNAAALVAGSVFVFVYTLVVAIAMVRNALSIPYSWLVRPRFLVYLTVVLDLLFQWRLTLPVLCVCDLLLCWKLGTGFRALRRRIPGADSENQSP